MKRMAPITSEILRHFSKMTKADILDMIHEEEGKVRQKLLVAINTVLQNAGEERLDLRKTVELFLLVSLNTIFQVFDKRAPIGKCF